MGRRPSRDFRTFEQEVTERLAECRYGAPLPKSNSWSPEEQRSAELMWSGFRSMAQQVHACGRYSSRACRVRMCPRCRHSVVQRQRWRVHGALKRMSGAMAFVLMDWPSGSSCDLAAAIDGFRAGFTRWKRRARTRALVPEGLVGSLEPHLPRQGEQWLPHCHAILGADPASIAELGELWTQATGGVGTLKPMPNPVVDPDNLWPAVEYAVKPKDWCPEPGELALTDFKTLVLGIYGRQLPVRWRVRWVSASGGRK